VTFEMLDSMLRSASTGIFLMLAILIIRDFGWRLPAILGAWSAVSGATYTICTLNWHTSDIGLAFFLIEPWCVTGPISIWLFSLCQFRDRFRLEPAYLAVAAFYLLFNRLHFDVFYDDPGVWAQVVFVIYSILRASLIIHMVYVAWQGREDDLLEERRRFRMLYIHLVSITISIIFVLETFFKDGELNSPALTIFQSGGFFALSVAIFLLVTQTKDGVLLLEPNEAPIKPARATKAQAEDPTDDLDLKAIRARMTEEKLYLQQGLTIAGLASACGLPEHRLRRLVNRHLGYRNFADYLNAHRVDDARKLLSDKDRRNMPILTIAMDLGYGSVGPFNRAFKERTGQTPSEYRRQALAESAGV